MPMTSAWSGTTDLTGYSTYRVFVKFASDQDFLDRGIR